MIKREDIKVLKDAEALALEAARYFVKRANEAIETQGRFSVALAGGSTPKRMHALLASDFSNLDWSKVFVFFGDERFVAPDNPESNYLMAADTLLTNIPIPDENIFPYVTVAIEPEEAAALYTQELETFFQSPLPSFDAIFLGMGPDGHTASIFPGFPQMTNPSAALIEVIKDSPKPPPVRLSFSLKTINLAKHVCLLAAGSSKAKAIKKALNGEDLPIGRLEPAHLRVLLDEPAAEFIS